PAPSRFIMYSAMAVTEPLSSINLPNRAPSRKSGKNWPRNVAALPINVWVQWARSGSPLKSAATMAASGASRRTLQPRKANQLSRPSPARMPIRLSRFTDSTFKQQHVDIGCRPRADVVPVGNEKFLGAGATLRLQHFEKRPLSVEFRRGAELR